MEVNNKLYRNIGVHVITTLFTVDKGVVKVLLIKRSNDPYRDYWALPSGALYNNELLCDGCARELKEKTGLVDIDLEFASYFDRVDRSSLMRMIGMSFIGVINTDGVCLQRETLKTSSADFFDINDVPCLAYDHNDVISESIEILRSKILDSNILKGLLPDEFTLPELQSVYECLLGGCLDRRNFRKKLINEGVIEDLNRTVAFKGKRPAKLYRFCDDKNVF